MKYLLINTSVANLQINLYRPAHEVSHTNVGMHRPGPVKALNIQRGCSVDLVKIFGSLAVARAMVMASKDVLNMLRPGVLVEYACDDEGIMIQNIDDYIKDPQAYRIKYPKPVTPVTQLPSQSIMQARMDVKQLVQEKIAKLRARMSNRFVPSASVPVEITPVINEPEKAVPVVDMSPTVDTTAMPNITLSVQSTDVVDTPPPAESTPVVVTADVIKQSKKSRKKKGK